MPNRGHAADGKAGLRTHKGGVGPAQGLPRNLTGLLDIHLIAASGQEQNRLSVRTLKHHRLDDLVEFTANRCGGVLGGAGAVGHFDDPGV